jgi:hypothetical protein
MDRLDAQLSSKLDALRGEMHSVRVKGLGLCIPLPRVMLTVIGQVFGSI